LKICTPYATTVIAAVATVVTAGFVGIVSASNASADQATDASTHGLGSEATLVNGDVVQGWTVTDLKPSTDAIPYPVRGTLWEATATDEAIKGSVIPIVSGLDARTSSGQTYPALYQVATPQGVNPATLAQGQKTTGKVYFDVTGDKPTGVVYATGGQELASWAQSQSPQRRLGSVAANSSASGPSPTPAPAVAPARADTEHTPGGAQAPTTPAGTQQAPAGAPAPTAPAAGSQGTPITGSQGTPMPANSPATPAPEASPAPPAPGASPAPPAPGASPAPPAPGASPATPAPGASPATPAPVSPAGAPTPTGSQGSAGSPMTPSS
jgi:hypothetical protein